MTNEELVTLVESIGPKQVEEWETGMDTIISRTFHEMFKDGEPRLKGTLNACVLSATNDHDLCIKILFMGWMMGWKTSEMIDEVGELEKLTKLE